MKRSRGTVILILTLLITAFLCFTAAVGLGPDGSGAAKNISTGLDLAGGVSITYQTKDRNPDPEALSDTIYKLQLRVEQYSTEAQVYQEGNDRISIEIPGVSDADAVLEELGKPGSLSFIEYQDDEGNLNFDFDSELGDYALTRTMEEIREAGCVVLEGTDVADAKGGAYQDQTSGLRSYVVSLSLTEEGSKKFAEATAANVGLPIAIVYDGGVISAPKVNEAITAGQAQISGMADFEEAQTLASFIRIGSLSLELEELRSSVVAAQLGEEAIETSVVGGAIGIVLVMLFMIIAYRLPGFVAAIVLIIYTALNLITLYAFDITLTLPGIAGIILGIGMAVDANVIIFARIREEIGAGETVRKSIKVGFEKAFSAIFDGNITTLIAAMVLMWLGTGPVKGFAYTLTISIIISMFSALVISRLVLSALYGVGFRSEKFFGSVKPRKPINFVGNKKIFFAISIILILSGPIAMLVNSAQGKGSMNFSLEFSGGTATTVTFNEEMDIKQIDAEVVPVVEDVTGDGNVQPTKVVGTNQVIIKTRALNQEEREALNTALVENFGVDEKLISTESISGTVSNEMRRDAVVSVIVSTIFMLIYIWFRFKDVRFGASAVLALLHDVLVVVAFYAISRTSVGNTFIACLLTIVGYSINATIVIFDRIRENLNDPEVKLPVQDVVNKSITETLTRSIYTSFTTFLTVAVLYVVGVSSIKEFAAPLMVGVLVGGFSSVCITGALWLVMKTKMVKGAVQKKGKNSVQQIPAEPKKKNRKRVAERLAAQQNEENK